MKKIDDSRLYFYFGIATIAIAIILGLVSLYSILLVEPKIEKHLSIKENVNSEYKKAYILLREPQIFGGYKNFDADGISVKNSLNYFDRKIYFGEEFDEATKTYLLLLLDRRKKGSRLGTYTMSYLIIVSLLSWIAFFHEKKQLAGL